MSSNLTTTNTTTNSAIPPPSPIPTKRPQLTTAPLVPPTTDSDSSSPTHPDLTLPITLNHAIDFLTSPLSSVPPSTISNLRTSLINHLTPKLKPTWNPARPSHGSAIRSLIALPGKLPPPLEEAAMDAGVDIVEWAEGISETGEWEMWVDPGSVCWRDGGWMWCEEGFEWRTYKQTLHTVWQTPLTPSLITPSHTNTSNNTFTAPTTTTTALTSSTPLQPRQSHAIPIRAPAVFRIPPTPLPPTVEFGGLSLGTGKEAREELVGEMMACPPSPSEFKRKSLPVTMGNVTEAMIGVGNLTSLNTRKSLLPAVEINGLVAKKQTTIGLNTTTASPAINPPGHVVVNVSKSNPWQVPSNPTTSIPDSIPQENRNRSISSGSSSQPEGQPLKTSSVVDDPFHDGSFRPLLPLRTTSHPFTSARSVSTSSSQSTDSGVSTPSTPAIGQIGQPSSTVSSSKTATPGPGSITPSVVTDTPQQSGSSAIRGRAPGPGATGLAVSVQPYDGGNVGVLGGGVKLGGAGAIKTGPSGTSYKLKNATPGSAPPGLSSTTTSTATTTNRRSQTPNEIGRSPAYEDVSSGEGTSFPTTTQQKQRGTATSPARPVKRRRGKPQSRPWQPKSHTSFVGAMGLQSNVPGMGPTLSNGSGFPQEHVRGISVPSGMPNLVGSLLPPPPPPQAPSSITSQGVGIWGSPSPPLPHPGQGVPFGGMPFGGVQQQQYHHHQQGPSAIATTRINAGSPGWNMAPPFIPSRTL